MTKDTKIPYPDQGIVRAIDGTGPLAVERILPDPEPDSGEYASVEYCAVIMWGWLRTVTNLTERFRDNASKKSYSAKICKPTHRAEFKECLLANLTFGESTMIFFDAENQPRIYDCVLLAGTILNADESVNEAITSLLQREWQSKLKTLRAQGMHLVTREYLVEHCGAIPFNTLSATMQQKHFNCAWENQIYPKLIEQGIYPKSPGLFRRLGNLFGFKINQDEGNDGPSAESPPVP